MTAYVKSLLGVFVIDHNYKTIRLFISVLALSRSSVKVCVCVLHYILLYITFILALLLLHNICCCFGCCSHVYYAAYIVAYQGFDFIHAFVPHRKCFTASIQPDIHTDVCFCMLLWYILLCRAARTFVGVSCGHPCYTHLPHAHICMLATVVVYFFVVFYSWQLCVWFRTHFRAFSWTCVGVCVCVSCRYILRWCFATWCCDNIQ